MLNLSLQQISIKYKFEMIEYSWSKYNVCLLSVNMKEYEI